jgi:site-specific DNA-methyltransferase (adenine-specific)
MQRLYGKRKDNKIDKMKEIDLDNVKCYTYQDESTSQVFLMDNMEMMRKAPDKFWDLAVVDPPYGIGEDGKSNHSRSRKAPATKYTPKNWDKETPTIEYFNELFRVSKNQIIWGGNYFGLPASSCWLVWDKLNSGDFADCELAWTSFTTAVRKFTWRWNGMLQQNMNDKENRIHPTQKPVALYDWIFNKYATAGMKILDTHLGSGSSRISANKAKLDFWGCEIDEEYFEESNKRFMQYVSQLRMF